MSELDGKVAVVTGGSLGIGRACTQRLASAGAAVVFCRRDVSLPEQVGESRSM